MTLSNQCESWVEQRAKLSVHHHRNGAFWQDLMPAVHGMHKYDRQLDILSTRGKWRTMYCCTRMQTEEVALRMWITL